MDLFIIQSQYESLYLDSDFDMNPIQINNLSEIDLISIFLAIKSKGKNK